jgi:hypothetical protein
VNEETVTQEIKEVRTLAQKQEGGMENLEARTYDSSCLSCFNSCPRKFFWRYVKKFELKGGKGAMDFGSSFHKVRYLVSKGMKKEAEDYIASLPSVQGDEKYSPGRLKAFEEEFEKHFKDDPLEMLHVEVGFVLPFQAVEGVFYSGRIDRIAKWQGKICVEDYKTSGSVGLSFMKKFAYPHLQADGYVWATRELAGSCDLFVATGIATCDKPREGRFQRTMFSRSAEQIAEFDSNTALIIRQLEQAILEKSWIMRTSYCEMYGGCPYRSLCAYGEESGAREFFEQKGGEEE